MFHKIIDGRYRKGSTILATNIDFKQLGDYLGDPVITAAAVDRMVHHSIIITIQAPPGVSTNPAASTPLITPPPDLSSAIDGPLPNP